jgi:AbrB family looped-hinge helix DNA binding protein
MPAATVTSKGQITIPKEVRDRLGLEAGDRVEFIADENGAWRIVAATKDVRAIKGIIARPAKPVSVEEMNRAVRGRGGRSR